MHKWHCFFYFQKLVAGIQGISPSPLTLSVTSFGLGTDSSISFDKEIRLRRSNPCRT